MMKKESKILVNQKMTLGGLGSSYGREVREMYKYLLDANLIDIPYDLSNMSENMDEGEYKSSESKHITGGIVKGGWIRFHEQFLERKLTQEEKDEIPDGLDQIRSGPSKIGVVIKNKINNNKMNKNKLLINQIMSPGGTTLVSRHNNDFKSIHEKIDGLPFSLSVEGGNENPRVSGISIDTSIYSDDSFEVIRRFLCKPKFNGKYQPTQWTPIYKLKRSVIEDAISSSLTNETFATYYAKELAYRKIKDLFETKFPEEHILFDDMTKVYVKNPYSGVSNRSLIIACLDKIEVDCVAEMPSPTETPDSRIIMDELTVGIHDLSNMYEKMDEEEYNDLTPYDVLNDVSKIVK